MADTGRANPQDSGDGGRQRQELDALLQRIAAHVAEVEQRQPGAPSDDADQRPAHGAESTLNATNAAGPIGHAGMGGISEQDLKAARRALRRARLQAELGRGQEPSTDRVAADVTTANAAVAGSSSAIDLTSQSGRAGPEAAAIDAAAPSVSRTLEDSQAEPPAPSATQPRRVTGAVEPPALRSALGEAQRPATPRKWASLDEGLDAEDTPASSLVKDPSAERTPAPAAAKRSAVGQDSPWDVEQAEALTRSYETAASEPPLRSMLDIMGQQIQSAPMVAKSPVRSPLSSGGAAASSAVAMVGEPNLDVMSAVRRVEAALELLAPRTAIEALDHRFMMVEMELQKSTDKLDRLDGIEGRLGDLAGKLSDDHIVSLFGSLVPTAEDLTQFAEDAAGRAAERVLEAHTRERALDEPAATSSSTPAPELRQLSEQLTTYMDDRRRTDSGTLEALETLQLAMQHLLDRLDRVEGGATEDARMEAPVERPVQRGMAPIASMSPVAQAAPHVETAVQDIRYEPRFEHHEAPPPRVAPIDLDSMPDAPGYDETRPVRDVRPISAAPDADDVAASYTMRDRLDHKLPGDEPDPVAEPASQAASPPMSDRQAFIAMARKAAERAKSESTAQSGGDKAAKGGKPRGPAAPQQPGDKPDSGQSGVMSGLMNIAGGVRPAILAIALIATLLLLGYMFIAGPKIGINFGFGQSQVSETEEAQPQEKSAETTGEQKSRAQPDLEKESRSPDAPDAPKLANDAAQTQDGETMREASYRLPPASSSALGISVQESDTPANPMQVMQARERARLAALSQRTAAAASINHQAPPGTTMIETASVGSSGAASPSAAQPSGQLELPPATAGPLSLRLAAAKGVASAQLEIATRLAEGKGVKQNLAEAVTWYRRAAEQGEPVAQYRLATLYERGMGVGTDPAAAATWYRRAADAGNLKAQHNLAVLSASPRQGAPDYVTAAQMFTKAAGRGLADSQYNLGVLYESGLGVPKDHTAAYKWYTLAARSGDVEAARRRDQLIARLPAEAVQAGERLVAEFRPESSNVRANNAQFAGQGWNKSRASSR